MYPGKWAVEFPEKPAAINSVTDEMVSFKQLDERSNRLAQLMWARGIRPDDHIAIFMENNLRYFEVVWAALRSGLHITPINRYLSGGEAGYILDNCGAKLVVASKALGEAALELPGFAPNCDYWLMVDGQEQAYESYEEAIAQHTEQPLEDQPNGQFMLYSSGTTGRPKGIKRPLTGTKVNQEPAALGALHKELWKFDQDTVYLSPAPLYHSAPVAFSAATQALGGTVVMMPKFDETAALETIEKYKVTHTQMVPTMFTRMLKLSEEVRNSYDLTSFIVAIHSAAPCPKGVKQQMFDWWGPIIYEYFSSTEGVGFTHVDPHEWLARPGTVGKPMGCEVHICDESGQELPAGEAGILYFESPENVFSYHNDKGKILDTQHAEQANWRTIGDMGYVDEDGYLFLTDRATFMIISGGVNIYPQEVEDTLIMHPKVEDVAVVGVPDSEMGEAVKAVVQTVEGIVGGDALEQELLDYARDTLAHYKCPRSIDFMDELPRLPTGKLYKRILKDSYWGKKGTKIV